jgi:uncharacterized protein (TIGR03086 family)
MAVRIKSITFDCADPYRLAQFWRQLTGFREDPDNGNARDAGRAPLVEQLGRAFDAVAALISNIRADQWSAPTPCPDWTVRQVVNHLIGMNRVFAALLADQPPPPRPSADHTEDDPAGAYRDSAAVLQAAFGRPGVLERAYQGPLGTASGAERLKIRLYDLLAHGWDLAQATEQPADLPDDLAAQSLAFARSQLTGQARPGRFGPAQIVADQSPAIERLVAFLGRPVSTEGRADD